MTDDEKRKAEKVKRLRRAFRSIPMSREVRKRLHQGLSKLDEPTLDSCGREGVNAARQMVRACERMRVLIAEISGLPPDRA